VYKIVIIDSELSFNTLLKSGGGSLSASPEHLKSSNVVPEQKATVQLLSRDTEPTGLSLLEDVKHAETSFLFNLCIFAELGNAKNNLILMYALSPSLFELLTSKLSPCNSTLADFFPNIQHAILNRLYSHCSRFKTKAQIIHILNQRIKKLKYISGTITS
jgi:hypothetical protein